MTSNALMSVADMKAIADSIVKSKFYGFKSEHEVLAVMAVAQAHNKHPATVVEEYDIINGRPALKSSAALARFQLAGGKVQWDEVSPTKAKGTFAHPSGGTLTIEWTIDMARKAGLVRPGSGWERYPEDMLCARVAARAIRKVFPACLTGAYLVEEVVDFDKPLSPVVEPPKIPTPPAPPTIEAKAEPVGNVSERPEEWPLMVPNLADPYVMANSAQSWADYFNGLVEKIERSPKYKDDVKADKIQKLLDANRELIERLPADIREQLQTTLEG